MPATYDTVAAHIKGFLANTSWHSFTTDEWTNQTKTCLLLSFTGHFLHELVRRKVILSAMLLEDHDREYIAT